MSTENNSNEKAPANLSTDDLAALFTKKRNPSAPAKDTKAGSTSKKPTSETAEGTETEETETETDSEENQSEENTSEEAGSEETETEQQQSEENETAEETEGATEEENPEEQPEEKPLHPELQAAIEEARRAGHKGVAKMLKRLSKMADQRDTERNTRLQVEQERDQLREQLENAPAAENGGDPTDRHSSQPQIVEIDDDLARVEKFIAWCDDNPGGGTLGKGENAQEYDADAIRKMKRKAESDRSRLHSDRSSMIAKFEAKDTEDEKNFTAYAHQFVPALKDKNSEAYKEAEKIFKSVPTLRKHPGRYVMVSRYLLGIQKEQELMEAAKKPASKLGQPMKKPSGGSTPPKVEARPGAAAPKVNGKQAAATEATKQFQKTGSVSDLAKRFSANRQARQDSRRV